MSSGGESDAELLQDLLDDSDADEVGQDAGPSDLPQHQSQKRGIDDAELRLLAEMVDMDDEARSGDDGSTKKKASATRTTASARHAAVDEDELELLTMLAAEDNEGGSDGDHAAPSSATAAPARSAGQSPPHPTKPAEKQSLRADDVADDDLQLLQDFADGDDSGSEMEEPTPASEQPSSTTSSSATSTANTAPIRIPRVASASSSTCKKKSVKDTIKVVKPSSTSLAGFEPTSQPIDSLSVVAAYTDRFSRLRVVKPLLGSQDMERAMEGEQFMGLKEMCRTNVDLLQGIEFITIAVIASKSLAKASEAGNKYQAWTLSALKEESLTLLLFGEAYDAFSGWDVGQVIVVFHPKVLPAREVGRFSLSVNSRSALTRIGASKDFGLCGATTKRGEPCSHAINKSASMHCDYHARALLQRAGATRGALNGVAGGLREAKPVTNASTGSYASDVYAEALARTEASNKLGGRRRPAAADDPVYDSKRLGSFDPAVNRGRAAAARRGGLGVSPHVPDVLSMSSAQLRAKRKQAAGSAHRQGGLEGGMAEGFSVQADGRVQPGDAVAHARRIERARKQELLQRNMDQPSEAVTSSKSRGNRMVRSVLTSAQTLTDGSEATDAAINKRIMDSGGGVNGAAASAALYVPQFAATFGKRLPPPYKPSNSAAADSARRGEDTSRDQRRDRRREERAIDSASARRKRPHAEAGSEAEAINTPKLQRRGGLGADDVALMKQLANEKEQRWEQEYGGDHLHARPPPRSKVFDMAEARSVKATAAAIAAERRAEQEAAQAGPSEAEKMRLQKEKLAAMIKQQGLKTAPKTPQLGRGMLRGKGAVVELGGAGVTPQGALKRKSVSLSSGSASPAAVTTPGMSSAAQRRGQPIGGKRANVRLNAKQASMLGKKIVQAPPVATAGPSFVAGPGAHQRRVAAAKKPTTAQDIAAIHKRTLLAEKQRAALKMRSKHAVEAEEQLHEEMENRLERLEQVERVLETGRQEIKEAQRTLWDCRDCHRRAFKALEECKKAGHTVRTRQVAVWKSVCPHCKRSNSASNKAQLLLECKRCGRHPNETATSRKEAQGRSDHTLDTTGRHINSLRYG